MAYRRRQQIGRETSFKEEIYSSYTPPPLGAADNGDASSSPSDSSIAARAIRASSAHRGSSLSSAYAQSDVSSRTSAASLDTSAYQNVPRKNSDELKQGFWGVLARKTKSILDDNTMAEHEVLNKTGFQSSSGETSAQYDGKFQSPERHQMSKSPTLQKGIGAVSSSLDYIGGRIGNAFEEGRSVVENRTADIFQETGKLRTKIKGNAPVLSNEDSKFSSADQLSTTHSNAQLKGSRDVAMAMAAKAKLLLREIKTVKVDLAFAKDRCAQLEEENKRLRESREKGETPDDDDLIRLQLESLLAEKARLGQENSDLARENRFLREVVEYHQLTMQDIVYLDENSEEFTEIYPPNKIPSIPNLQSLGASSLHSPPISPSPPSSNGIHNTQLY